MNYQWEIFTVKTYAPNLVLFLEQFHQHSSLPPVVIPHLGWDWRVFRLLLSVNIGTSEKMNACRNRCVQNAVKALPRIRIGLVKILIIFKIIWKSNTMTGGSRSGPTIHRLSNYSHWFKNISSKKPVIYWLVIPLKKVPWS